MNTQASFRVAARLSSGESLRGRPGNCDRELIHPEVFMTGHFKWPLASAIHKHFLRPLIRSFSQVPACCSRLHLLTRPRVSDWNVHSRMWSSVILYWLVIFTEMCTSTWRRVMWLGCPPPIPPPAVFSTYFLPPLLEVRSVKCEATVT